MSRLNIIQWVKTKESMPAYGEPALIKTKHRVENITYMLNGCDNKDEDWFEPVGFNVDQELNISIREVQAWAYLPG